MSTHRWLTVALLLLLLSTGCSQHKNGFAPDRPEIPVALFSRYVPMGKGGIIAILWNDGTVQRVANGAEALASYDVQVGPHYVRGTVQRSEDLQLLRLGLLGAAHVAVPGTSQDAAGDGVKVRFAGGWEVAFATQCTSFDCPFYALLRLWLETPLENEESLTEDTLFGSDEGWYD